MVIVWKKHFEISNNENWIDRAIENGILWLTPLYLFLQPILYNTVAGSILPVDGA
jgi:hypothetical protein